MKSKFYTVIAYDDTAERFDHLSAVLSAYDIFFACVEHPAALNQALDNYECLAVLLDYDLRPLVEYDFESIAEYDFMNEAAEVPEIEKEREINGYEVARECLIWRNVPVILASANSYGRKRMKAVLEQHQVPIYDIPANSVMPEENWLRVILNERMKRESERNRS